MENSKTVAQTFMGETAHFGFCPPKIDFFEGPGGKIINSIPFRQGLWESIPTKTLGKNSHLLSWNILVVCPAAEN